MNKLLNIALGLMLVAAGFLTGLEVKEIALREQLKEVIAAAIEADVAEFYLDEHHEKKFRFIRVNGGNK